MFPYNGKDTFKAFVQLSDCAKYTFKTVKLKVILERFEGCTLTTC